MSPCMATGAVRGTSILMGCSAPAGTIDSAYADMERNLDEYIWGP